MEELKRWKTGNLCLTPVVKGVQEFNKMGNNKKVSHINVFLHGWIENSFIAVSEVTTGY